jgi:hypothetical protein
MSSNKIIGFLSFLILLFSCNQREELTYEGPEIHFGVIGDYGDSGGAVAEVAAMVRSWSPEFIVTTGDNNYPYGEYDTFKENISNHYCDYIYNPDAPDSLRCDGLAALDRKNRFFTTLGNHDYDGPLLNQPYLDYFTLPGDEITYDFIEGPIHFFMLNSCTDSIGQEYTAGQEKWLEDRLTESTSPFKICIFHHPPFSYSKHGSHPYMQYNFSDLGIDLVIAGHNHIYERLTPVGVDNFYYITNGLGGRRSIDVCDVFDVPETFNRICYNAEHGAMRGVANGDSLVLEFLTLTNQEIIDQLVIYK